MMDPESWQAVQAIFADAVDLSEEERESYLSRACAGRVDLFAEARSLLEAHRRAGAFIEPIPSASAHIDSSSRSARRHGAVYRAVRDDGQFDQQVAVKLLGPDRPRVSAVPRRAADPRAAVPSHRHAARRRHHAFGRSYIVMEYVDGTPIDRYCRDRSRIERLRLFRTVCAAVQYAHQNLVVHRDLKPANILVTAGGVAKLLDFGIAKILAPDGATTRTTRFPAMTPDYASPEQVRGGPISTASDIYSLGVLLHLLSTGDIPTTSPAPATRRSSGRSASNRWPSRTRGRAISTRSSRRRCARRPQIATSQPTRCRWTSSAI
jgi:serine/threonine protein kinase